MTAAIVGLFALLAGSAVLAQGGSTSGRCEYIVPPASGRVIAVKNIDALEQAVRSAKPRDSIVLADGEYRLRSTLEIQASDVVLRGASGDASKVVIRGGGMTSDSVGVAIGISAQGVTIAAVTVRDVGYHAVQVRGEKGASRFTLTHAHLRDTGQQLLKGSLSAAPVFADEGRVLCSEFSYTESAPTNYTNGVDLLGTKGWTISDNRFLRIRGPKSGSWSSGPAILVWAAAEDTIVERNVIVDSFRGIALGLAPGTASYMRNGQKDYDHLGGLIRNNVVINLNPWADEAIEANGARDVRIEHNTVLVEGSVPWSIGVRWPSAFAYVRNNLTNRQVLLRNGGRASQAGNITDAVRSWFVNPIGADLRLTLGATAARHAGVALETPGQDFGGYPRPVVAPDVGAFQSN